LLPAFATGAEFTVLTFTKALSDPAPLLTVSCIVYVPGASTLNVDTNVFAFDSVAAEPGGTDVKAQL
jgi:hypothetical protein